MAIGRPTLYSDELTYQICAYLAAGWPLTRICKQDGLPAVTTVYRWLDENESFRDRYTRAREDQADTLADEIIEISDDGQNDTYTDEDGNERTNQDVIARSRLRVDARKWVAAKLKPKKYGDKIQQEVSGKDGGPGIIENVIIDPAG